MKIPETPPPIDQLLATRQLDNKRIAQIFQTPSDPRPVDRYLHWDKLRHRKPPGDLSHEEWWLAEKLRRKAQYKSIANLRDKAGNPHVYAETPQIQEHLHHIDFGAGGRVQMPDQVTNPETRDQYCVSSLIEEAITSSQLEGAATTRQVAKEMIKTGRSPQDHSEQMILNNYKTMQRIGKLKGQPLTRELVFDMHQLITRGTLDDEDQAGRFRRSDEPVVVDDMYGEVFHDPPPSNELSERMKEMCAFANADKPFVHPVLRSIILHYWLAYDHPFVDGNGRTARALFYWSMLRHGYWLCEFISISHIIRKAPAQYGKAFLFTETDENDLTYFILYHLEVIQKAVEQLHAYIRRKTRMLQQMESELHSLTTLNHRQRSLIAHALRHPGQRYTVESHRLSHNVVYETARRDLLNLEERRLLQGRKIGRTWHFKPIDGLEDQLRSMS